MGDGFEFKVDTRALDDLKKEVLAESEEIADEISPDFFVVIRRSKGYMGRKSTFQVIDGTIEEMPPGMNLEDDDLDDESFEGGEVFGGDPEVRKFFPLKGKDLEIEFEG